MTPEAGHFLARTTKLLEDAKRMLEIGSFDAGGRTAYLGAFHAAQALIFEEDRRIVKTHNGVHTMSQMLLRDDPTLAPDLRNFLSQAYLIKTQADYGSNRTATFRKRKPKKRSSERRGTLRISAPGSLDPLDPKSSPASPASG